MKILTKLIAGSCTGGVILLCSSIPASALTYNFSFSGTDGAIPGTVTGFLDGLPFDSGGIGVAATGATVTSAPPALGYTLPAVLLPPPAGVNSFTIVNGVITDADFLVATTGVQALYLSANAFGNPSQLTISGSSTFGTGVEDSDSSSLTFSLQSPSNTPKVVPFNFSTTPGLIVLGGISGLNFLMKKFSSGKKDDKKDNKKDDKK